MSYDGYSSVIQPQIRPLFQTHSAIELWIPILYGEQKSLEWHQETPNELIIRDGNGPILIRSTGSVLKGIRLVSGESYKGSVEDEKFNKLKHISKVGKTSVVSIDDTYSMKILDPESYLPITLAQFS